MSLDPPAVIDDDTVWPCFAGSIEPLPTEEELVSMAAREARAEFFSQPPANQSFQSLEAIIDNAVSGIVPCDVSEATFLRVRLRVVAAALAMVPGPDRA